LTMALKERNQSRVHSPERRRVIAASTKRREESEWVFQKTSKGACWVRRKNTSQEKASSKAEPVGRKTEHRQTER